MSKTRKPLPCPFKSEAQRVSRETVGKAAAKRMASVKLAEAAAARFGEMEDRFEDGLIRALERHNEKPGTLPSTK